MIQVLRNVTRLDGSRIDIAIKAGRIAGFAPAGQAKGDVVRDVQGAYVSSGWIDLHVHAFRELDPYGDEIDEIGVTRGVTTIVDAGSCGADRIGELELARRSARTNVLAFLNVSRIGLQRIDELSNLEWLDPELAAEAAKRYPDFIVGLKARVSGSVVGNNGIEPLRRARSMSELTGLRLMVHIGSDPPNIGEIMPLLNHGDIVTHYLHGKRNRLFDANGNPLPSLTEAIDRGVRLDVGHGTASFSFRSALAAKRHNIGLHTISTDIYRHNRMSGPVYDMSNVLTKFLSLGYTLEDTIRAVTETPANWLGRPQLGRIQIGDPANLTLFAVRDEATEVADCEGNRRIAARRIESIGAMIRDEYIACKIRS